MARDSRRFCNRRASRRSVGTPSPHSLQSPFLTSVVVPFFMDNSASDPGDGHTKRALDVPQAMHSNGCPRYRPVGVTTGEAQSDDFLGRTSRNRASRLEAATRSRHGDLRDRPINRFALSYQSSSSSSSSSSSTSSSFTILPLASTVTSTSFSSAVSMTTS